MISSIYRLSNGKKAFMGIAICWLLGLVLLNFLSCQNNTDSKWENLSQDVKYVGAKKCQSCHEDIYATYQRTGMGQSWYQPARNRIIEAFLPAPHVYDAHSDYHYTSFWKGDSMYIQEFRLQSKDTTHQRTERIDYIVGSGHQTRSYVLNRNGFLYEAPITWYVEKSIWDLSPGYHDGNNTRFDRGLGTECLHCHNAYTEHEAGTQNRYRSIPLGIDCERCHGPGSLHVERMLRDEIVDVGQLPDYSIVNPAKLPVDLQFDVCQQCHLQGINVEKTSREFRPGMSLASIREVFLVPPADTSQFGIASHAARLRQSQCFLQSQGRLTCTTCHDPHVSTKEQPAGVYNKTCQSCHKSGQAVCSLSDSEQKAANFDCVRCHMPKGGTSDIPHVSFSDHYIRILKSTNSATTTPKPKNSPLPYVQLLCATSSNPSSDNTAKAWLLYYEQHESKTVYLERALSGLSDSSYFDRSKALLYSGKTKEALEPAQKAMEQEPANAFRQFHLAQVLERLNRNEEALEVYGSIVRANPAVTEAANRYVSLLIKTQQGKSETLLESERVLLQVIALQRHQPETYANLGFVYLNMNRIPKAKQFLWKALYLNPEHQTALQNLTALYRHENQSDSALYYQLKLQKAEKARNSD